MLTNGSKVPHQEVVWFPQTFNVSNHGEHGGALIEIELQQKNHRIQQRDVRKAYLTHYKKIVAMPIRGSMSFATAKALSIVVPFGCKL